MTQVLTLQPKFPKLRLNKYMTCKQMRLGIVLLVALVFLAGQFHFFCSEQSTDSSTTHVCQLCATAGSAILSAPPSLAIVAVAVRLETPPLVSDPIAFVARITSPRAPPSL